jgi:hypothetical protein
MTHPNGVHQRQMKWPNPKNYLKNLAKNHILSGAKLHAIFCPFATMAMFDPTFLQVKGGKAKNFCVNEKCQFVLSFFSNFQDLVCGNGQQSLAFW